MTKKKLALKILCAIVAFGLIALLLIILNGFVGNPISSAIAKQKIEKHINENYDSNDFVLEKVTYNFKFGAYQRRVASKTSKDTHFYVTYRDGKIRDSYEDDVLSKFSTWTRLVDETTEALREIIKEEYSYQTDFVFAELGKSDKDMSSLILDMPLDIHNPPLPINLNLSVFTSHPSDAELEKALLEAYQIMKKNNIPIDSYSVSFAKPKDVEDSSVYKGEWSLYQIPVKDVERRLESVVAE